MVLVTPTAFRCLASAPKVHWQAGAEASPRNYTSYYTTMCSQSRLSSGSLKRPFRYSIIRLRLSFSFSFLPSLC